MQNGIRIALRDLVNELQKEEFQEIKKEEKKHIFDSIGIEYIMYK